jgi:hypothetical protein
MRRLQRLDRREVVIAFNVSATALPLGDPVSRAPARVGGGAALCGGRKEVFRYDTHPMLHKISAAHRSRMGEITTFRNMTP